MKIEKFVATENGQAAVLEGAKSCDLTRIKKGYTYYAFVTEEKSWIKHSNSLTNEERQWVIKHESTS